jgi:hypothetical protein
MEFLRFILVGVYIVGFLVVGLIQLAAIVEGLNSWVGLPTIISIVLAFFLAYTPILGAVLGIIGATSFWGWSWYWAALLFFWPIVLFFAVDGASVLASVLNRK